MEITGEVKLKKNQNTSLIAKKLKATNYRIVEVTDDRILIEKRAQKGDITLGEGKARYLVYFDDYHIYLQSLLIFVFLSIVGWALLKTNIIGYFGFRNILLIAILTALSTHDATRASIKNTITNKVFGQKDFFLENLNRNFLLRIGVALGASSLIEYVLTLTPRFLAGSVIGVLLGIIFYYKYPTRKKISLEQDIKGPK